MSSRSIVVGDVHGCSLELLELLDKLAITSDDEVFFVGDVIEKGYDSAGCIDIILGMPKAKSVCGNHDNKAIRFLKWEDKCKLTGQKNPMTSVSDRDKEQYSKFNEKHIEWLKSLPISIELSQFNTVIVHGGLLPCIPIHVQVKKFPGEVMRLRFVDESGHFVSLMNGPEQPPDTLLWPEVYDHSFNVVYGHIAHDMIKPRIDVRKEDGIECVGIDTGCVVGGSLTAYVLDTKEFVQVKAKKQYAEPWRGGE